MVRTIGKLRDVQGCTNSSALPTLGPLLKQSVTSLFLKPWESASEAKMHVAPKRRHMERHSIAPAPRAERARTPVPGPSGAMRGAAWLICAGARLSLRHLHTAGLTHGAGEETSAKKRSPCATIGVSTDLLSNPGRGGASETTPNHRLTTAQHIQVQPFVTGKEARTVLTALGRRSGRPRHRYIWGGGIFWEGGARKNGPEVRKGEAPDIWPEPAPQIWTKFCATDTI